MPVGKIICRRKQSGFLGISASVSLHVFHALQHGHPTSIIVLQEAALLVRYRVPLSFLYDLTGDAHAIILHVDEGFSSKAWTFPFYVHYNPETTASTIAQGVGGQFIREDRGQDTQP
jgi:hypothetical protein